MIEFKTSDPEYPSFELPTKWEEVTLDQYLKFIKQYIDTNYFNLISIFSGIPQKTLQKLDPDAEPMINQALSFLNEGGLDIESLPVPDTLIFRENEIKIPKDLAFKCLGQKLSCDNHIIGLMTDTSSIEKPDLVTAFPFITAIYLHPLISDEDYDEEKAEELIPEILNLPVESIYPIASFFLRNSIDLMTSGHKLGRRQHRQMKKGRVRIKSKKK